MHQDNWEEELKLMIWQRANGVSVSTIVEFVRAKVVASYEQGYRDGVEVAAPRA